MERETEMETNTKAPSVHHLWNVGCVKGVEHHIGLNDDRPFPERLRTLAPEDVADVWKSAEIIRNSRSCYASPIVVTRKNNGDVHMCIDDCTLSICRIPDHPKSG